MSVTTADVLAELRDGQLEMALFALRLMSVTDPDGAKLVREAIGEVEAERRRRRGADPLWVEHVAEQNAEWWSE